MSLKSNASPDEKFSPYYVQNEDLCKQWKQFAEDHNGKFNGIYNAWSFDLKIKLKLERTWLIRVKKGTYSNASIWFNSGLQNLQEILELKANFTTTDCPDFHISPSWWKRKQVAHPFCQKVKELLANEKHGKNFVSAQYKKRQLTLTFHHRNDAIELVKRAEDALTEH